MPGYINTKSKAPTAGNTGRVEHLRAERGSRLTLRPPVHRHTPEGPGLLLPQPFVFTTCPVPEWSPPRLPWSSATDRVSCPAEIQRMIDRSFLRKTDTFICRHTQLLLLSPFSQ